ncbi:MAG: tRNA uracil 4-sulfurtransferase ThiI [Acholeplasmataceae bacterium]|nr:tRNA uracil 4-sulfurtransferase ThiI [Acholeplasmataceae bacterium]
MTKKILIRFGDMMLKGRNIGFFIKRVRAHLVARLDGLEVSYEFTHDRIFIGYNVGDEQEIISRLKQIQGIYSFSVVYVAKPNLDDIILKAIQVLNIEMDEPMVRLKIETKRHDKSFPMTSLEITQKIASPILNGADKKFIVDVKNPKETLYVEIRADIAFVHMKSIKGMGGFPFGTQGKGLLMMSGGIDSPVAAYLAMKQGIEVELFHFESTPLTPLESVQKVVDLAKKLAIYTPTGSIKLHLVPFTKIHEEILAHVFEPYTITIMRRMMYRLAERFTRKKKLLCLINGESVGQVASQTLNSMQVVEAVTKLPILRPVITYDKQEIIDIAKKIDTFDISIRAFNDCCSIYVPKAPATRPMEIYALKYEQNMEYDNLLVEALLNVKTLDVSKDSNFNISKYGFTVFEAIALYEKELMEYDYNIQAKQII